MSQKATFSGKHKPAADAVLLESVDSSGVLPAISVIVFAIAAVVLGAVGLGTNDPNIKFTLLGFALALLVVAVFGRVRAKKNKAGARGGWRTLALDGYGAWWSDGQRSGRIAWGNLLAVGVGQAYQTTGGVIGTTPTLTTLELFPANTRQAADQSSRAGDARTDGPPPNPALPSTRLRFEIPTSAPAQVEQAVARFASQTSPGTPRWIGVYSLGVENTLTGGVHPPRQ